MPFSQSGIGLVANNGSATELVDSATSQAAEAFWATSSTPQPTSQAG